MNPRENAMQMTVYPHALQVQLAVRPVEQNDRTNPSKIKPDKPWKGRMTFVEDFIVEHSVPGTPVTSIEISGHF
jgi:hypothetical protein